MGLSITVAKSTNYYHDVSLCVFISLKDRSSDLTRSVSSTAFLLMRIGSLIVSVLLTFNPFSRFLSI